MKIVHVYKDYHPPVRGGIEQTIERVARSQVAAGHDVTVLVSASRRRSGRTETLDGVRVVRVGEWARVMSTPVCPGFAGALSRLRADVWHLHYPFPVGELAWLLVRPSGAMVVTYHSDVVRQKLAMAVYAPVARALLDRADLVMPTSAAYVEHSPFLRRVRDRCRVVPLGVDLEPFAEGAADPARVADIRRRVGEPFVLFVGRLRYYKGLDVLLDAMALTPGRLVIVGDGPEEARLRARHARLGLGDRVTFAGAVPDAELHGYLRAAAVGVLPSVHPSEALGIAMIEYLASGLPVVCTELGTGTTWVNRDGETGLVVPPRDPVALAAALRRLLEDPDLRDRFGESGRRRARELFSRQAMVAAIEHVYAEALSPRSPSHVGAGPA